MDGRTLRSLRRTSLLTLTMVLVLFVLSGCAVGGDEDESEAEPTTTDVTAVSEEAQSSPADLTGATLPPLSSPVPTTPVATGGSTPVATGGSTPMATGGSTPVAGEGSPTPAVVVSAPPVAMPTMVPTAATPLTTPGGATPVAAGASPAAQNSDLVQSVVGVIGSIMGGGATASATPVNAAVTTVPGCEVTSYPPYQGSEPEQVTTVDVFFRAGPGTDCDTVLDDPLSGGTTVTILSEPVAREGDDEFQWIAVSVDGSEGWLATEFVEPASGG